MKKFILIILLLVSSNLFAQVVNIPDPVFKNLLLNADITNDINVVLQGGGENIDINNDNEIQVSEALAVLKIEFEHYLSVNIATLEGIKSFSNLTTLQLGSIDFSALDLSDMSSLQTIRSEDSNIGQLNLSGCTALATIDLYGDIQELNCTNCTALINFWPLAGGGLINVNFAGCTNLKKINISLADVLTVNVTGCTALEEVILTANDVTTIDVSTCTALKKLDLTHCPINSITLGQKPNLEKIILDMAGLTTIDLSGCPNLKEFECASCHLLNNLDFSANPILDKLFIQSQNLQTLNLKNGKNTYSYFDLSLWTVKFVCIDEGEESFLASTVNYNPTVNINTYCFFTPGGSYNTIAGQTTIDVDNNGCGNGTDIVGENIKIKVLSGSDTGYTFTDHTGNYNLYALAGTHTVAPVFENNWFNITPAFQVVNFTNTNNNTFTQNFCIVPNGVHPDVEVVIAPGWAQPGFDATYALIIKNNGNQVLSGDMLFSFDDNVQDYVSADPLPSSVGVGALTWSYSGLLPFETRIVRIVLNANGPMETPSLNNGDVLTFNAVVTPLTGDENAADNLFTLTNELVGSFDPNDIACLEGDFVHPDKIGEYLHYNINFENTGTAPATFVVVKQDIDPADFDITSLQLLTTSHGVTVRVTENKVEYIFDNISLGAGQKGNLIYKIKSRNTLVAGDDVKANANIYFDYNWPITTNDANTSFQTLSTGDFAKDDSVTVYPNPSKGLVNIKANGDIKSVELYDVQGRLLQSSSTQTIDVSQRASGIYFLKIRTEMGVKLEKLVRE